MGWKDRKPATMDEYLSYRERFKNWGRWGADDQMGTLNHITDETRKYAASLVKEGRNISMSLPIPTKEVMPNENRNPRPAERIMSINPVRSGSTDFLGMHYHGFVTTHLDALSHIFTEPGGRLYNDRPNDLITMEGAKTNSVDYWKHGIVTRGVLYDIPRLRGTPYVSLDQPVEAWDLEDWAKKVGITPQPGDAVIIRSGLGPFWAAHPDLELTRPHPNTPGNAFSIVEYLYETNASLLVWDLQEAAGQERIEGRSPIHYLAIPYMGMPFVDNADLEDLADHCAETGRYEFMLTVAPLFVKGGTGSPVNPLAMF